MVEFYEMEKIELPGVAIHEQHSLEKVYDEAGDLIDLLWWHAAWKPHADSIFDPGDSCVASLRKHRINVVGRDDQMVDFYFFAEWEKEASVPYEKISIEPSAWCRNCARHIFIYPDDISLVKPYPEKQGDPEKQGGLYPTVRRLHAREKEVAYEQLSF